MSKQFKSIKSILQERYIYQATMDNAEMDCYNRLLCSEQIILERWEESGKIPKGVFVE